MVSQPELTVLNVNVPAVAPDQIRGTRWAKIDEFGHFNMASQSDGGTILDFGARDRSTGTDPDSDTALCLGGYVTLSVHLHPGSRRCGSHAYGPVCRAHRRLASRLCPRWTTGSGSQTLVRRRAG